MLDDSCAYVDGPWTHRTVSAAGARFHVAEAGEGPLVLLLHGFPQFWWAWRSQLTTLSDAGHRAVAVDLRGYGASDKTPRGYDLVTLAQDAAGLVGALGSRDAVVVGHGVGGLIGWTMTAYHPEVVRALAVVSSPHPRHAVRVLASGGPGVRHMLKAQLPILPEHRLLTDGGVRLGELLREWSAPGWPDTETEERYRRAFAIPKVSHCSLEYHRWIFRSRWRSDGLRYNSRMRAPVRVPVLQVHGALDPVCPPDVAGAARQMVTGPYRWRQVPDAGHFPHEERPEEVSRALVEWLARVSPGMPTEPLGAQGNDGEALMVTEPVGGRRSSGGRMGDRDRNVIGQAQNQRPRDRYGRPMPHGSRGEVERVPDDAVFSADEGLHEAQKLLDAGYAFTAHEVLEAVWKSAPDPERELWRGLAQTAVGITHAQRGNMVGAARLLRRGAERVEPFGPDAPHGVDVAGVAAFARALADELDAGRALPGEGIDPSGMRLLGR